MWQLCDRLCSSIREALCSIKGALQIIDGKAKVISEVFCDGLGACIGECPEGALKIVERVALEFDEEAVENHLESINSKNEQKVEELQTPQCSCPSSQTIIYETEWIDSGISDEIPSALRQWPIKLTLVSPKAPYFNNKELTILSDCAPLAYGDFHRKILKGKPIVTICPMLSLRESELNKLEQILKLNPIKKVNLVLMEVPCCQKIRFFIEPILSKIERNIEVKEVIISRDGKIR